MTTRKRVSEKTLELNVTAEILQSVRGTPDGASAFWVGMKQHQEARNGIDELLANVPSARHLAVQFKAPGAARPDSTPYTYSLNENQHQRLLALAQGKPRAVWYAFPNYNTFARMRLDSPSLLNHTYLMSVAATGQLHGSASGRHRVECHETPVPHAMVFSDPIRIELLHAKRLLDQQSDSPFSSPDTQREFLTNEELVGWLEGLASFADGNLHRVGQWLRGFGTLCVP